METPLHKGKSSTTATSASSTPTPDSARPAEVAKGAQNPHGQSDGKRPGSGPGEPALPDHERRKRISEAAYYKSERRGFRPGEEERDWLEAEKEINGGKAPGRLCPEDNNFPSPK